MTFASQQKTVKCVQEKYFAISISQDEKGIYHVVSENFLSRQTVKTSWIDYGMASFVFDSKLNSFQGN